MSTQAHLHDAGATPPWLPEVKSRTSHIRVGIEPAKVEAGATMAVHSAQSSPIETDMSVLADAEQRMVITLAALAPVFCAALSGFLAGYDTGIIIDALVQVRGDLTQGSAALPMWQREYLMSAAALGALLGSLIAGFLTFPRRWLFGAADCIFVAGAILQAKAADVWTLIGGRFVVGVAIGISMCIAPVYVQELAPARMRGRFAVFIIASVSFGQLFGYAIAAGMDHVPHGWRWLFGLGAVPAAVQLLFLPRFPESPRVLVQRGEVQLAEAVLSRLHPSCSPDVIAQQVRTLQDSYENVHDSDESLRTRLYTLIGVPSNRRALGVAMALQALQQLCGFNSFMYYGSTLFNTIGFKRPAYFGLVIAGTSLLFTLLAMHFVDSVGRRLILLWSIPAMAAGLVLAAIAFHFLQAKSVWTNGQDVYPPEWSAVVLLAMLIYIAAYAVGLGHVPWQQGELLPLEIRPLGVSLASATNWAASFLVGSTYVPLMRAVTSSGTYGIYAAFVVPGYVFCVFCYPETAGLSLEEVREVFRHDFGVATAARLRHEKRTWHAARQHILVH